MAAEEKMLSGRPADMARETLITDLLTCQLCFNRYDDANTAAKCLPCQHGFCVDCLGRFTRGKPKFTCPVCRRDTTVPEGGVQALPDNFIARRLKEVEHLLLGPQDVTRPHLRCGSCIADGGPAVSVCSHAECVTFLCQNCDQAHRTMRKFDDHVVHSIEDLQKRPEILTCKEHRQKPLSLYCDEESCQKVICLSCKAAAHSSHRVVDLDKKSLEVKGELQSLAAVVESKKTSTHHISGQLQTEINRTSELFDERSAQVSAFFDDLHELLKKRHDAVIGELKKRCFDMTRHNRHLADRAESLASQFDSACQFAERACNIGNPVDVLNKRAQVISRLHELIALDLDTILPFHPTGDTSFLSFDEDRDLLISDFERLLPRLGRLNASGGIATVSSKVDFVERAASPLYAKIVHRVRITSEDPSCSFDNLSGCLYSYLQSPDGTTRECSDVEQCGESFEFEFKPLEAGPHQLNISLSGVPIKDSPFLVNIEETPPLTSNTDDQSPPASDIKMITDVTWPDAFVKCEHTIVVKFSGLVSPQFRSDVTARFFMPDSLQASHDPKTLSAEVNNHQYTEAQVMTTGEIANYRVVYTPPVAGKLIMSVFMDGQPIANSPFVINVNPLHPDSTIVSSHLLGKCPPGTAVLDMPYSLTLQTCDHHGNGLTSGGYNITAGVTTSSSQEPKRPDAVKDNQDGSYTVTVAPRAPEPLIVNFKICGYPLTSGMPLVIPVQDSLPFEDPPDGYKNPSGMAVDINRKTVYIAGTVRAGCHIHQLKTDGSFMSAKTINLSLQLLKKRQLDLAVTQDGSLLVLVPYFKRVVTCDFDGKILNRWSCSEDNRKPVSITLSGADHVIVGDGDSHKLFIHQRKGEIVVRIQLPEGALSAGTHNVCVDSTHDDILVVTHSEPYQILRYTINENLVCTIDLTAKITEQAMAAEATPEGALILSLPRSILVLAFTPDRKDIAVVKEFKTDHAYTRLAVIGDECFVAFDPAAKHLAKYSYYHGPLNQLDFLTICHV
ncbi:uncharacterized protein LOC119736251 [Patiria miniata]|uniref:Uncharacterized protein n=1 Tax=Patiria miniata TaxID=46514 RepID=A0A914AR23_PATMI|nr:uncharacterized protein LOC119736251 [Patiria miniata]